MTRSIRAAALFSLLALAVVACGQSQPARFYMLTPLDGATAPAADNAMLTVGVGPISVPAYLDRPQIVSRSGPNTLTVDEFDRWGEPLEDMIPRVLAENLSVLLGTERVFLLPRRRSTSYDYQVEVEFSRFDADADGSAVLAARWAVYARGEDEPLRSGQTTIRTAPTATGFAGLAAALSTALGDMSREIAGEFDTL